mmetsp:Transcript_58007/g.136469  ORF Transcript_58007/g.136469 Transcript_58007/m.136469 type:complete len:913 (-) Transcript_58007:64-2802(-)
MSAEFLKYEAGVLKVLDQQKVTQELKYVEVHHAEDAWTAIRQMHVGSMHLAAIVAALGLAVDVKRHKDNFKHASQSEKYLLQKLEYLRTALPNTVYYSSVIDELRSGVEAAAKDGSATGKHVIVLFRAAAEKLWSSEMDAIDKIGKHGAHKLVEQTGKVKIKVLTICNQGTLTTAGHGTALGVVRELQRIGYLEHVYACETRPINQSKLSLREISAFEIVYKGLPGSLITESAAAYLMATKHVDCVVVGADRIAANGDMCNDLGTYSLAISAMYHKVPFFCAARTTVVDLHSSSFSRSGTEDALRTGTLSTSFSSAGDQSAADTVTRRRFSMGPFDTGAGVKTPPYRCHRSSLGSEPAPLDLGSLSLSLSPPPPLSISLSPSDSPAKTPPPSRRGGRRNTVITHPLVDVTPCSLVTGIITEVGVASRFPSSGPLTRPAAAGGSGSSSLTDNVIDIPAFLRDNAEEKLPETVATPKGAVRSGYTPLKEESIAAHVMKLSAIKAVLGDKDPRQICVTEVGDGNLNYVYILKSSAGTVVAKQALPYVRCVGESWPLSLDRAEYEAAALRAQYAVCPYLVPKTLHFDRSHALIVMQFIPPPHKILRKCFMAGERISTFAKDVGTFLGRMLFESSALRLDGAAFRSRVADWSRNSLCGLTEQVVFTDPYHDAPLNRHTSPQLDEFVGLLRRDAQLVRGAAVLKSKFMSCAQALVHGDLHTGSVMACEGSTFVIDPEFAFYGPMGFDLGAFLGNLLLAYYSTPGHERAGESYGRWLLHQAEEFYSTFCDVFLTLWRESEASPTGSGGELYSAGPFPRGSAMLETAREVYMEELWRDTVGFAGVKMIRRIVGLAHVADLDEIADAELRSECEKRCLLLARRMVVSSYRGGEVPTLGELLEEAHVLYQKPMAGVTWPVGK